MDSNNVQVKQEQVLDYMPNVLHHGVIIFHYTTG